MPAIDRQFRGEHQPAVDRGHKRELISVGPEAQGSFKFLCFLGPEIEANVRSALLGEEGLKTLLKELTEHSEETDKITLSSSVRTDQDIDIPEFEGGQVSNGLVTLDRNGIEYLAHRKWSGAKPLSSMILASTVRVPFTTVLRMRNNLRFDGLVPGIEREPIIRTAARVIDQCRAETRDAGASGPPDARIRFHRSGSMGRADICPVTALKNAP
jgi:hypothetical protein